MDTPTFHEGEIALQEQTGVRERLAQAGSRVIRDYMPEQHRVFFEQLPFVVVGSVDSQGGPTASVLAGPPGFMRSPDERHLVIFARPGAGDPLAASLRTGAAIGLLGIEPHTRRRNRANGRVIESDERGFAVEVSQSFGNCPKYIQARRAEFVPGSRAVAAREELGALDAGATAILRAADTFFIASAYSQAGQAGQSGQSVQDDVVSHGVDVSHRGGKPGFVRVDGNVLTVPDFLGNFYFNTLGNLLVNPRCGLLFIDYDKASVLQISARAEIITDGDELKSFVGAQRLLRLHVESASRTNGALPLRWDAAELSPALATTGAWP